MQEIILQKMPPQKYSTLLPLKKKGKKPQGLAEGLEDPFLLK